MVGTVWVFRFDSISADIARNLDTRIQAEYADESSQFRKLFDDLQKDSQCCGVNGPLDYNQTWWLQVSDRYFDDYEALFNDTSVPNKKSNVSLPVAVAGNDTEDDLDQNDVLLPWSCCVPDKLDEFVAATAAMMEEPVAMANSIRGRLLAKSKDKKKTNTKPEEKRRRKKIKHHHKLEEPVFVPGLWCTYSPYRTAQWHHHQGCSRALTNWFSSSADSLLVIGFCVIGFLKFTFLAILHYEIREMIQKIQMLENETNQMNGALATALGMGAEVCSMSSSSSASSVSSSFKSPNNNLKAQRSLIRAETFDGSRSTATAHAGGQPEYHELTDKSHDYHAVFNETGAVSLVPSKDTGNGSRQTAI